MPQAERQALVNRFQRDPRCALFKATNADATGLNLRAADTDSTVKEVSLTGNIDEKPAAPIDETRATQVRTHAASLDSLADVLARLATSA